MKKLFTLLTMLIVGIGSSWADKVQVTLHDQTEKEGIDNTAASSEATADHKYGSYSGSDVANIPYYTTFTTNATSGVEGLTLSTTSKILKPTFVPSTYSEYGHVMAIWYDKTDNTTVHTFTLTAPNGYYIKTYSFKAISTSDSGGFTISAGGNNYIVRGEGYDLQTIANEVYAPTTTFTVQRNTTNNNSTLCIYSFTVVLGTIGEATWNSGIESSSINNHFSTVWYLKLTSPEKNDVFFNTFSLSHRASNSADDDIETYLAFTYNKFNDQLNHQANEFIAISSNSLSGHSSTTAVVKEYTFSETVRINGNTDVYACFVSKNNDGTYSLRKRGLGVNTGGGSISISAANNYTTTIKDYACTPYYSCTYTTSYVYPQTNSEYHIWWKNNVDDRTVGGQITISAIKMTTPGTTGQYVHFDRFSILLRDADVTQNTYLLFSKTFLLGSGVTNDTEFEPSNFTAVSTNYVPSANYGKVFDFQFDSNQYLDGNNTYYVYMGIKKENGNFCLRQYGIFINHQYDGNNTGFATYQYLTTTNPNTQNTWCPIWYSNKCQFADQKVTVNIKEAGTTIRTKTLYSDTNIDLATALNIPSVFTVTPASITHSVGATSQDVDINASFVPSSAPATEANHRYFFKLHGKYAGGENGKTLSASTNMSEKDQWVIGGNYYDGYTFYNVGQAKYLSVQNGDNSQGTFVAESSASKFIAGTNSTGFGFRLLGSRFCYLNDNAGSNVLSTWKNASAATDEGSRIIIEDPFDDLSDVYTDVNGKYGTTLGKYNNPSYTQEQINTALSNAVTAYAEPNASGRINATLALREIRDGLVLNMPTENTFLRIKSNSRNAYLSNTNNQYNNINKESTLNSKETIYLFKDNNLINYGNGQVISERYADYEQKYFPTIGEVGATPTTINFSAAATEYLYNIGFKDNTRSLKINEYASDAGESGQTGGDYDFKLEEVTSLPVTLKAAGLGYATFNCPVPVKIPSGVSAYVSKINGTKIKLYQIHHDNLKDGEYYVIPANTPVLLHVDGGLDPAGDDYEASFVISDYDGEGISGDDFYGTIAAEAMGSGTYYSLRAWTASNDTYPSKVGFYTKSGDLAGFKAWIHDDSSSARNFTIVFDGDEDPTGIVEALGLENDNVEIYDLNGRKLSSYKKGINIVNGKKLMVK